jgi:hypothetical protein
MRGEPLRPWNLRVLVVTVPLLFGCRDAKPGGESSFAARHDDPLRTWSAERRAESSADAEFTRIEDLDVDSRGRIVVADAGATAVAVLSPDGRLLHRLGGRGEGPGEFAAVTSLQVLAGDTVLVYDRALARVTLFPADRSQPVQTIPLASAGFPAPFWVVRTPAGQFVAAYRPPTRPGATGADAQAREVVRVLGPDARTVIADSVLAVPPREALVARSGAAVARLDHPMGRRALLEFRDGMLYHVWTDSAALEVRTLEGEPAWRSVLPAPPVPVAPAEVDSVAAGVRAVFRDALREAVPRHWPAVGGLAVDDQGRAWIGLTARPGDPAEWAVVSRPGTYEGSVTLPYGAEVKAVRGNRIYAVVRDELDVPRVVAYEYTRPGS